MKESRLLFIISAVLAAFLGFTAPCAVADDTFCAGAPLVPIGAIVVDNVIVPPFAYCRLIGTTVLGNVKVLQGAILESWGAMIHGNVQADQSFYTDLYVGSRVGGNVQIKNSEVDTDICGTEIFGDLQLENIVGTAASARVGQSAHPGPPFTSCQPLPDSPVNRVIVHGSFQAFKNQRPVVLRGSQIGGNVQYFENFDGRIFNNQIGEDLECEKNVPPPVGGGNAAKNKEGQCAAF